MPTKFSPKEQFQSYKEHCAELQAHRQDQWMTLGFAFSIAEMAHNGASAEQLYGARAFISTFQNLWEKGLAPVPLPRRTLDMDNPTGVEAPKPEEPKTK